MTSLDVCTEARRLVKTAHDEVLAGKYGDALTHFEQAHEVLREQLGDAHPEVTSIREDVEAVREMGEITGFMQALPGRSETTISPSGKILPRTNLPQPDETD